MRIHPSDNVEVNTATGHKSAVRDIEAGEAVIKYGFPIGYATKDIKAGEHVHTHHTTSALTGLGVWAYHPTADASREIADAGKTFRGYLRKNGDVGIRNELWIIPTVGCANCAAKVLADKISAETGITARALTHQFGCSQLGDDLLTTQKVLCGLIRHPNAGGVLVLGLGCEENHLDSLRGVLGEDYDHERVRFLNLQDCGDETVVGMELLRELTAIMAKDERTDVPLSKLRIGVKCGGSDGYSGITANPLVGQAAEKFADDGAAVLMTEIPEVFGAEEVLLARCQDRQIFDEVSAMIQRFQQYFIDHGEGIADNPSPGNVKGGITTLEEKSLGCVQKGGHVPVCGALAFGAKPVSGGLWMVDGPGNDLVAVTNLAASGAHLILFTTGRGTPLCAPVPTLKLSTNNALAEKKPHWIDFNAGRLLDGVSMDALTAELYDVCVACAEGSKTVGEKQGFSDIALFKNGVTL